MDGVEGIEERAKSRYPSSRQVENEQGDQANNEKMDTDVYCAETSWLSCSEGVIQGECEEGERSKVGGFGWGGREETPIKNVIKCPALPGLKVFKDDIAVVGYERVVEAIRIDEGGGQKDGSQYYGLFSSPSHENNL